MSTVTFGINISLDGYCDHTISNPGKDVHDYFTAMMEEADLLFFGRVMYQLMFPYWSDMAKSQSGTDYENRFAQRITAIDKVVVSRSLSIDSVVENTRIVRSNPAKELLELKQQPGKKILVDSISMLPELMTAGLIDEFRLVVHPVFAGNGRPLLEAGSLQEKMNLILTDTIRFQSGCIALHYQRL